ncbi:DAZ-associated protein 1-like isoform X4 [Salvelinus namaycush]|uniref:DAZ-associated protein 1-like isoform X4 n=1 Tax=Salvelinus namaycush TaxID=8040 RepID=A0A8U1EQN4_SALNM|nr:DAZ-associated protein 1-like isoform X4 [Salvelinus namaycush]
MNSNLAGDEVGKLFVGGLDWSTTQETLRNYFSQYGEVVDCVIMKDKTTNQSRGFGFVKFKDPNCVRTVLETKPHNLDGRNIDPKPCTPRGMQPEKVRTKDGWKGSKADSNKSKKIFVGGIPHNCGEPELREYFNRFGVVEVKKAEPRDSNAPGQLGPNQWGPRGILSAANGWSAQPAQGWQQSYGPPGVWVSTGQPLGGYGPPLSAGRGAPAQPPSPFNAFLVTAAPAGGFGAPQAYAQQGYSTPPQFGYSFGTPHGDQYAPQGVPPPPTTPGTGPLGFAPATTPTQDMSKASTGQPDFPYSQYGLGNYPQEPSSYGPTRPSHSNGQDVQGENSAGYGQDLSGFGHTFADPSQQTASYGAPTAQPAVGPQATAAVFARVQNHNVTGFHPYRR